MNPRVAVSGLARSLARHGGVTRLLSRFNSRARILMLHGVGGPEFPEEVFRAELVFLRDNFRIVPLHEVWQTPDVRNSRPKVALTFDDGLRNNFTVVYPLLCEFRVAATFFVCPGLIESRQWLWNHECRLRLAEMPEAERFRFGKGLGLKGNDVESILRMLKDTPHRRRLIAQEELREATPGFKPTDAQRDQYDIMTWEELKSLDPAIVNVGGHSTHHEILPELDPEDLDVEVGECRTWLERELRRPAPHFCYPDGAYNAEVRAKVGRHFESAVTTTEGMVSAEPSLLDLPRIPIATNLRDLAWRMQSPSS